MHPCTHTQKHEHTYRNIYICTQTYTQTGGGGEKEREGEGGENKLVGNRVNGRIRTLSEGGGELNSMKQQGKGRLELEIQ